MGIKMRSIKKHLEDSKDIYIEREVQEGEKNLAMEEDDFLRSRTHMHLLRSFVLLLVLHILGSH